MNRRDLVAGLASVGVLGGGALAYSSVGGDDEAVDPVAVETIDAPGSRAGEVVVPERGRTTFLEVFATWCSVCEGMMPTLRAVHDEVDGEVQFVSVTNEPVGATVERGDVADWWRDHDGNWPVGVDADLELTAELDVRAVPTAAVLDERNRIVRTDTGATSRETLLDWIDAA